MRCYNRVSSNVAPFNNECTLVSCSLKHVSVVPERRVFATPLNNYYCVSCIAIDSQVAPCSAKLNILALKRRIDTKIDSPKHIGDILVRNVLDIL